MRCAGKGCINWQGTISVGLDNHSDKLHKANYGACMAAKRADLIAVGGSDEHLDYLGYVCGPYELTFRLMNYGLEERWLLHEYLYHTWHPNENSINTEYHGPHDGRFYAPCGRLEALADRRVLPCLEKPLGSPALPVTGERVLSWKKCCSSPRIKKSRNGAMAISPRRGTAFIGWSATSRVLISTSTRIGGTA